MKEIMQRAEQRMEKRVRHLETEYATIRAGRANPAVLDKIMVDYYGTPTSINQLAAVNVTEARILTITPWDASVVHGIEKAIQISDLGINPQTDGKTIRIVFPPLTEDRRKEIVKEIHRMSEESKISMRNVRRDAIEDLKEKKKKSEISEDELKLGEKKVQELTDKFIKEIEKVLMKKEKELMEI